MKLIKIFIKNNKNNIPKHLPSLLLPPINITQPSLNHHPSPPYHHPPPPPSPYHQPHHHNNTHIIHPPTTTPTQSLLPSLLLLLKPFPSLPLQNNLPGPPRDNAASVPGERGRYGGDKRGRYWGGIGEGKKGRWNGK